MPEDTRADALRIMVQIRATHKVPTILADENKFVVITEQTVGEVIQACMILLSIEE